MSSPPPGPLDVRRLLARFILLVVLPSVGLIGFGVVAISNERVVVEKRFGEEYQGRLRVLGASLASSIDEAASALGEKAIRSDSPLVAFSFTSDAEGLHPDRPLDAQKQQALSEALEGMRPLPAGAVALVPVAGGAARGLYAIRGHPESLSGLSFDMEALTTFVAAEGRRLHESDPASWKLVLPTPLEEEPSPNPMRRLLDELTQVRASDSIMSMPLPSPLAEWRIVAELPGDDPVSRALWRNRTLYIVALSIFYIVITIGVIVTLRGISREARLGRMKTDFVTNISHELRTPLTSIRMFAETLRLGRARTEEERNACLDMIVSEAERLTVLTERSLEWGRLEAGRRAFVLEKLSVPALVNPVVDGLLKRGVLKAQELRMELPENLPPVDVDASALSQVLLNLLENAVKYSGPDRVITVRAHASRARVHIEVADNGIGIAKNEQKRIFERFYRANDYLARRTEGSGLGLSIARRILDSHQGTLTVKSRPGEGATFTLTLPAATEASKK